MKGDAQGTECKEDRTAALDQMVPCPNVNDVLLWLSDLAILWWRPKDLKKVPRPEADIVEATGASLPDC